jgi:hypothetical protein
MTTWSDRELTAWLDERLPADKMAAFENQLREDESLRLRVASQIRQRDQGGSSVGEIWQRERLSCPTRTELGGFLLSTLPPATEQYIEFHIRTVGCRFCLANLNDLEEQSRAEESENPAAGQPARRRRFFESSAGYLRSPHSAQ